MNNENILTIKVSDLTGSRLVNLEDFSVLVSLVKENPSDIERASLVTGFIMGRAARLNLSLTDQKDFEKIKDESCSVLNHMFPLLN